MSSRPPNFVLMAPITSIGDLVLAGEGRFRMGLTRYDDSMNFVADESVERAISVALRKMGYEVWEVVSNAPGSSDLEVLAFVRKRGAILIAADKDFGDLVYLGKEDVPGIVLIRLQDLGLHQMAELAAQTIQSRISELERTLMVVTSRQVRLRVLPNQPANG